MTKQGIKKVPRLTNLFEAITLGLLTIDLYENAEKRRVRDKVHVQRLPYAEKEAWTYFPIWPWSSGTELAYYMLLDSDGYTRYRVRLYKQLRN
ncbi:hypothetical protein [[Clostridium] aerotolerans]